MIAHLCSFILRAYLSITLSVSPLHTGVCLVSSAQVIIFVKILCPEVPAMLGLFLLPCVLAFRGVKLIVFLEQ